MKSNLLRMLLAATLFSVVACNTAAEEDIALENGRLRFSSEKVFEDTVQRLSQAQSPEALDMWEQQWGPYVSARTAFGRIKEEDITRIANAHSTRGYDGFLSLTGEGENREAVRNIDSPVLATLANQEGLILVGDDAFRFFYDRMIKINDFEESKLNGLELVRQSDASRGMEVYPITRKTLQREAFELDKDGQVTASSREVNCISDYWHGGTLCCKKRLVGEVYASSHAYNSYYWASIVGRTKHQKRTSGIWYMDATQELRLQLNGSLTIIDDDGTGSYPQTLAHDSTVYGSGQNEYTLEYYDPDASRNMIGINSLSGSHSGVCDDYVSRACSNTW
jgi:hypothetical protein